jgi:hypothetical protein
LIHGADRSQEIHDVLPTSECTDWQASTDDLSKAREIRSDAEPSLRPSAADAEPGDYLVEDEETSMRSGDFT